MLIKLLIGLVLLVMAFLVYYVTVSTGKIREYTDEKGERRNVRREH